MNPAPETLYGALAAKSPVPETISPVRATIEYLKAARRLRAAGKTVSYVTDPAWLVNMAINRRAGWAEPNDVRGSIPPFGGRNAAKNPIPRACEGNADRHLCQLAYRINTKRLVVRTCELGEWRKFLTARLPNRFHDGSME